MSFLVIFSCNKNEDNLCDGFHQGILKDMTGLDGCGWMIQVDNLIMLEPINLDDFAIELETGISVCFTYLERNDLGSYCMSGQIVEIDFIEIR